jgi:hypothetical protein
MTAEDNTEVSTLSDVSASYKSAPDPDNEVLNIQKNKVEEWKMFNDNQVVPLRIEQYVMYATLLNEQQDLYAKNTTLTENQDIQVNMVNRILSDFHNKGYGSMREFQSLDYNLHYKELQISIIKYTTLLASVIFLMIGMTMMGLFNENVTISVTSILIVVYLLVIFMQYKQNQVRRKYDWNKLYWKSPISGKKTADSCKFMGIF